MYGVGVFETLRTFNHRIFQSKEHIQRLFDSAKQINLKIKSSKSEIEAMLQKISTKSPRSNQRIKIIAVAEGLLITSTELKQKDLAKGVKCKTILIQRPIPTAKTISYLETYLSHSQAQKQGFFEAILIDQNGFVTEGSRSNIFWFEKDTLCTPKNNVLAGTIRDLIFKISPFKTKFKNIKLPQLLKQKEIFITSSINGVAPVIQIDKHRFSVGKNTKTLIKTLQNFAAKK
ncbi:MAG: aminotransferase class IV [Candidatus Gracilibacteria bacterium]